MTARLEDYLIEQTQRRPEATAAVFRDQGVRYGDVDAASNRLARALMDSGCVRGDRVALLLRKSPAALIAMLGTLKAGCIYVPIDTAAPAGRAQRILQSCECRCLLAEAATGPLLKETMAAAHLNPAPLVVWMDDGVELAEGPVAAWRDVETLPAGRPHSTGGPDDPAHILFTSGSTGIPKGVVITHANVRRFIDWAVGYFGIGEDDRISSHPPLHFDLSTFDVFGTFAAGAQVHLLPPELNLIPHRLADFIRQSGLTQWLSVPSALLPLARAEAIGQGDFPSLRRLMWCGEKFPVPALRYCMRLLPHVAFFNLYGPTETTIASSYHRVPQCPPDDYAETPIGAACEGESLFVLDDQMKPAPPGVTGHLYIGGAGLSPGYWRDPDKTAEVFQQNPFSSDPLDRLYRTGDLARLDGDGMIYLIGRSDSQIKSRGVRIELGDIEAAVQALPMVQEAAVVAVAAEGSDERVICCAYSSPPACETSPRELMNQLASVVPRYMIPSRWMAFDRMPRNANGKTDRNELARRFRDQGGEGSELGTSGSWYRSGLRSAV